MHFLRFVMRRYLFTFSPTLLTSTSSCVCGVLDVCVSNSDIVKCPLVDKLCNVNAHNMAEGCFCPLFFTYFYLCRV